MGNLHTLYMGLLRMNRNHQAPKSSGLKFIAGGTLVIIFIIAFLMWMIPTYSVWQQEQTGKAKLARAAQERQIMVEQANAELEAAGIRAQAIELVGEMAAKYPEYRQQEFIGAFAEALKEGNIDQIYYIPTEAGIPITEAGRFVHQDK